MRPTGPGQPAHLLLDVIEVLADLAIPYAVVGAFAVSFHGVPRSTDDVDVAIWLKGTGRTAGDLKNRLIAAGYRASLNVADINDPISGVIVVEDQYQNRMDLIVGIRGMDPNAPRRCADAALFDSSIRIIAAEDLIAMKIFAGGLQDLEDVRGILHVSGAHLDMNLLQNLARQYGEEVAATLNAIINEKQQ